MTTDLEALVVAAYVFADEYPVPARGGRRPLISDAELVALSVAQAAIGISSDRQFLGLIGRVLPGWFPHLPDQSQYNRRLRALVPANEKEYEPLADLLTGTTTEVVIADKGFWGRDYARRLAASGTRLLTPAKTRTAANLGHERALASTRLVIESVFANLKEQMRLERHLARTPAGLALRIAQRILALTIGILLNTLSGRPPRALAAYDGR
jgi:Transposase DDE domain